MAPKTFLSVVILAILSSLAKSVGGSLPNPLLSPYDLQQPASALPSPVSAEERRYQRSRLLRRQKQQIFGEAKREKRHKEEMRLRRQMMLLHQPKAERVAQNLGASKDRPRQETIERDHEETVIGLIQEQQAYQFDQKKDTGSSGAGRLEQASRGWQQQGNHRSSRVEPTEAEDEQNFSFSSKPSGESGAGKSGEQSRESVESNRSSPHLPSFDDFEQKENVQGQQNHNDIASERPPSLAEILAQYKVVNHALKEQQSRVREDKELLSVNRLSDNENARDHSRSNIQLLQPKPSYMRMIGRQRLKQSRAGVPKLAISPSNRGGEPASATLSGSIVPPTQTEKLILGSSMLAVESRASTSAHHGSKFQAVPIAEKEYTTERIMDNLSQSNVQLPVLPDKSQFGTGHVKGGPSLTAANLSRNASANDLRMTVESSKEEEHPNMDRDSSAQGHELPSKANSGLAAKTILSAASPEPQDELAASLLRLSRLQSGESDQAGFVIPGAHDSGKRPIRTLQEGQEKSEQDEDHKENQVAENDHLEEQPTGPSVSTAPTDNSESSSLVTKMTFAETRVRAHDCMLKKCPWQFGSCIKQRDRNGCGAMFHCFEINTPNEVKKEGYLNASGSEVDIEGCSQKVHSLTPRDDAISLAFCQLTYSCFAPPLISSSSGYDASFLLNLLLSDMEASSANDPSDTTDFQNAQSNEQNQRMDEGTHLPRFDQVLDSIAQPVLRASMWPNNRTQHSLEATHSLISTGERSLSSKKLSIIEQSLLNIQMGESPDVSAREQIFGPNASTPIPGNRSSIQVISVLPTTSNSAFTDIDRKVDVSSSNEVTLGAVKELLQSKHDHSTGKNTNLSIKTETQSAARGVATTYLSQATRDRSKMDALDLKLADYPDCPSYCSRKCGSEYLRAGAGESRSLEPLGDQRRMSKKCMRQCAVDCFSKRHGAPPKTPE